MMYFDKSATGEKGLWVKLRNLLDSWNLKDDERSGLLQIHPATYNKWKMQSQINSNGPWWERALKLFEISELLDAIFKAHEPPTMLNWLRKPNPYGKFGGRSPLEFMTSNRATGSSDLSAVIAYLKLVHMRLKPPQ